MELRRVVAPLAGAAVWVSMIMLRLRSVEEAWWIARDDAVITLSHARNAADFGSIGVSPGGDRVEGFSSPLHFAVAYLVQLVSNPDYRSLAMGILIVALALTGAATVAALRSIAQRQRIDGLRSDLVAVGLTGVVVAYATASWTSVGWIGSGMENPLVVGAGFLVIAIASETIRPRFAGPALVLALVMFLMARVEFAAFAVPLVASSAWLHALRQPRARRFVVWAQTTGAVLLIVAMLHGMRRLYFGQWLPNTAVVQDRSTGFEQKLVIVLIAVTLLLVAASSALRFGSAEPLSRKTAGRVSDIRIVAAVAGAGVLLMALSGRTAGSFGDLVSFRPVAILAAVVAALLVLQRVANTGPWAMNSVFGTLSAVPLGQYIALGPARLDEFRVAILAAPFLAFWAAALILHLGPHLAPSPTPSPQAPARSERRTLSGVVIIAVVVGLVLTATSDTSRRLNFEVTGAPSILEVVDDVRNRKLDGALAITANPDLGKVSFAKTSIVVDLGLLGHPLLTQIAQQRPDLVATYLHFVARPDVVEMHGFWSCQFGAWIGSPEFADLYSLSDDKWLRGEPQSEGCHLDGRWAIWVRSDAEDEYSLTRELVSAAEPAQVVRQALDECSRSPGDVFRCQPVRRAVQRASIDLRALGQFEAVVEIMNGSPSAALDVPLLQRNSGWANDAFAGFAALLSG